MEATYKGARTRARAAIASRREETGDRENSVVVKRRKLSNKKLKSHCDIYKQSDFSTNACASIRSSGVEASCCSSSRSVEELLKVSDLDQEECAEAETGTGTTAGNNLDGIERTTKIQLKMESDELDSDIAKPSLVMINASCKVSQEEKMPPEAELEEFFATVQESLTKRFKDRYNYDIVNDIPLEGRFEWIQVKQGE